MTRQFDMFGGTFGLMDEAWVALPPVSDVQALLGRGHIYDFGFVPAMLRVVIAHLGIAPKFGALFEEIMQGPGALSIAEREMVASVAAGAQDCDYCWQSHAEFFKTFGGDPEFADAIKERRWRSLDSLSPRERALCEVAEKLSGTPTRMVSADWEPLRDLGFDDQALLEVAHIVGIFNYLTRLADGMGLTIDPETVRAAETGEPLQPFRPA